MWDNATLTIEDGAILTFYFVGSESGYTNTLNTAFGTHAENNTIPGFPGELLFSGTYDDTNPALWFTSSGFAGQLVPGGGDAGKSIAFAYLNESFEVSIGPTEIVLFALDDAGAGPDDNHDDYVGYFVVSAAPVEEVPLPGAVWLFGSALLGFVTWSRRRAA
jgi:hypothetical protein